MGKTYVVQPEWFRKTDSAGYKISDWCRKISNNEVFCSICDKKISCVSKGFAALGQHVKTGLHEQNIGLKLNKGQMLLKNPITTENNKQAGVTDNTHNSQPLTSVQLFTQNNASIKAEVIWAMKTVQCNMAVRNCDDIKEVFQAMFPGCIPEDFSLGHTKLSYMITEALGPYFYDKLIEEVRESYFSLLYDETTNNENKKELQIVLRFWSEEKREVVSRHLTTIFLGHAKANDIVSSIRRAIHDAQLKIDRLLMIGSDGPNVNKAVKRILSNQLSEERNKPLMDIGTCNIHIVHTSFLKGLEQLGEQCNELIIDIYNFFKDFPSRWEDFEVSQLKVGVPQNKFIKHCETRWLTLAPAAERLLEQWPAIEDYFFKYIPSKASELMQTIKYKRITRMLKFSDMKLECEFVIESSKIFTRFTERFQKTEPLIHVLNDELRNVLKVIIGRVCKKEMINVNEEITSNKLLPIRQIDCNAIKNATLSEKEKLSFLIKVQKHYVSAYNYLISKISLQGNDLLQHFKCLQPAEICKTASIQSISKIAEAMPFKDFDIMALKDEWRLLQLDGIEKKNNVKIDSFWGEIIYSLSEMSYIRYPHIAQVVKAALCLSHGNSDVERGFSLSGKILTEDKCSMSERMLNCRLLIRDALKRYDNNVAHVPLTKELLNLCHNAHRHYKMYLEEQKKIKEELLKKEKEENEKVKKEQQSQHDLAVKKASIEDMEKKAEEIEKQKKHAQKSSDALLQEANERLSTAISKNDQEGIRLAQGLLLGAEELRKKERKHEDEARKMNRIVNKRKSTLINTYFKTKSAKT